MQRVSNHPVHLVDEDGKLSPSAFIPFCDFGGNMSAFGIKIKNTSEIHFCKIFEAKIMQDQLCYEVDLDKFSNKSNIEKELKIGFNFIIDFNEDRQVLNGYGYGIDQAVYNENEKKSLGSSVVDTDESKHALLYLDTLGRKLKNNILINISISIQSPLN